MRRQACLTGPAYCLSAHPSKPPLRLAGTFPANDPPSSLPNPDDDSVDTDSATNEPDDVAVVPGHHRRRRLSHLDVTPGLHPCTRRFRCCPLFPIVRRGAKRQQKEEVFNGT